MEQFDNYCNEQLEMIEEGKLGKLAAMGAIAASSAFGDFVPDWSKYYQTSQDPGKEARATKVIERGFTVPQDAKAAIKVAAYVFDGDDGHSASELTDYLEKTGAVESAYVTKIQKGGGPARSYWQVEPATAMDLVKNSSPLFGPKFHKVFGKDALKTLQTWDAETWSKNLESNDKLAACMAAAKWIASPW